MVGDSWTHRLARPLVRPLVGTRVTPNHLTTLRLLTGLGACAALAVGDRGLEIWGGWLWLASALRDRADGERGQRRHRQQGAQTGTGFFHKQLEIRRNKHITRSLTLNPHGIDTFISDRYGDTLQRTG